MFFGSFRRSYFPRTQWIGSQTKTGSDRFKRLVRACVESPRIVYALKGHTLPYRKLGPLTQLFFCRHSAGFPVGPKLRGVISAFWSTVVRFFLPQTLFATKIGISSLKGSHYITAVMSIHRKVPILFVEIAFGMEKKLNGANLALPYASETSVFWVSLTRARRKTTS